MPIYQISHRWRTTPIAVVEAETSLRAVEMAARRRVSLLYSDLAGADLRGAVLDGADLRAADMSHAQLAGSRLRKADLRAARLFGADLGGASLDAADLRHADLRMADLRNASLRGARLVGSDLRGALLNAAKLEGATLDWRWSVVALELLRDRLGDAASPVLTDLAFQEDERPFAWLKLLVRHRSRAERILGVLSEHIRPGDNAPDLLRNLIADLAPGGPGPASSGAPAEAGRGDRRPRISPVDAPATLTMFWTRAGDKPARVTLEAP
jgi:hypothetical protein